MKEMCNPGCQGLGLAPLKAARTTLPISTSVCCQKDKKKPHSPPPPPFLSLFEGPLGREGLKDFSFPFLPTQPLQNKQPPAQKHSTA